MTSSVLYGSPGSYPCAAMAKTRIGPEWVATMNRSPGFSCWMRRMPAQNRRTVADGGSKHSIGICVQ